jgi:hypothetical protein
MDIISAAESHFRALMDKNAFEINVCVKDQSRDDSLQKLITAIKNFSNAKNNYEVVLNLKSQLTSMSQNEVSDTDEN